MKTIKIEIPKGYEVCKETSTFEEIKFKKIQNIQDRIKTVEDAIEVLGECQEVMTLNALKKHTDDKWAIARQEWVVIVKALNEGWYPDFDNNNERKWYPCFNLENKAVTLFGVSYDYRGSVVPPSFIFKSEALCRYAVSQFSSVLEIAWS